MHELIVQTAQLFLHGLALHLTVALREQTARGGAWSEPITGPQSLDQRHDVFDQLCLAQSRNDLHCGIHGLVAHDCLFDRGQGLEQGQQEVCLFGADVVGEVFQLLG